MAGINGQELFFPEDEILTKESSDFGGTRIRFNLGNFSLNASYYQRKEAVPSVPNNPFALTIDSMFFIDSTQFIFKEALDVEGNFEEDAFILDAHFSAALSPRQSIDLGVFFNYNNDSRQQIFRDTEIFIDSIGQDTIGYIEYFERPKQQNLWAGLNYRHNFRILPSNELSFGTSVVLLPISRFESDNELLVHFDGIDTLTTDFEEDILDYVDFKEENFNNDFSYWSVGLFVEDKLKVSQWLTLNFGARVEINAQTQPIFAPQMAIRFTPFQQKTHFRFSYSRGYRLPTIRETDVVITDNLIAAPNPNPDENLMPETSDNFELGISQKIGKDLDLNLGLYHQALNDLIWNETTMINRQNDSTIAVTGLEGEIRISLPKGIRSYFNYNFQFDQKDKINWPSPLCKFGVTLPFFRHFSFFFEGQYEGERLNFDKTFTSSYFLLNTNLLVRPKVEESHWLNNFAFSVRAYNVLNEYYIHPSGSAFIPNAIPQNGRTWQTQLTYEF
ncbi:MAG: TonB-dependent receptor [Bacteroidota bacterium]